MNKLNSPPKQLSLSNHLCDIRSMHFDADSDEIFAIGVYGQIAITTLSGKLITIQEIPKDANIIAQQRTPAGWQFICQQGTTLTNCLLKKNRITSTTLEAQQEKPKTAAWSPCGKYVAIGSEGTTLTVWETMTGNQTMQDSVSWDNRREFINPPTLSVLSWNKSGTRIICIAKEIISSSIIVWDVKTKKLLTIIQ